MQLLGVNNNNSRPLHLSNKKNKSILTFKAKVMDVSKQAVGFIDFQVYVNSMASKAPEKSRFFISSLEKLNTSSTTNKKFILDVGCCTGEIGRALRDKFSNFWTIGLDLNQEMMKIAHQLDRQSAKFIKTADRSTYMQKNLIEEVPFKKGGIDAVIGSSVLHEVYSYSNLKYGEFSVDSVTKLLDNCFNILKPKGKVLMRDPAKPFNADKLVTIKGLNKSDGLIPPVNDVTELLKSNISTLSTFDKLRRFCIEFKPLQGNTKWNYEDCTMPKWGASEFIRHRIFSRTEIEWQSELNEMYGTFTPNEFLTLAKNTGFKPIIVENRFHTPEINKYKIKSNEMTITDLEGNILKQDKEFPDNFFVEIEKR